MELQKIFTMVGSRSIPYEKGQDLERVSSHLQKAGWTLRSGAAEGSDSWAEKPFKFDTQKEIYLPWRNFNNHTSPYYTVSEEALKLASAIHPSWDRCSQGAKLLHGRNCYQVLGRDLNTPSRFVIAYTEGGLVKGGTATAINLALEHNIPVFNFGHPAGYNDFWKFYKEIVVDEFINMDIDSVIHPRID